MVSDQLSNYHQRTKHIHKYRHKKLIDITKEETELIEYFIQKKSEQGISRRLILTKNWKSYNLETAREMLHAENIDFWKKVIDFCSKDDWISRNKFSNLKDIQYYALSHKVNKCINTNVSREVLIDESYVRLGLYPEKDRKANEDLSKYFDEYGLKQEMISKYNLQGYGLRNDYDKAVQKV